MRLHTQYVHYDDAAIVTAEYHDGTLAVLVVNNEWNERERLSVNLLDHGLGTMPGEFYVKDYAQHEGLAEALVEEGVAVRVATDPVTFGPHGATAWLMRLTPEYGGPS